MNFLQKTQLNILAYILFLNVTEGNKRTFEKKILWNIAEIIAIFLDAKVMFYIIHDISKKYKK